MMKSFIQPHRNTLSKLIKHLMVYPAVMLFILAIYAAVTGIHFNYNQSLVTAVAKATWLGKGEEGQIRIFECTDGSPINRATIIGHTNPCPNSEVKAISIADSARLTTLRERELVGELYVILVLISVLTEWVSNRLTRAAT